LFGGRDGRPPNLLLPPLETKKMSGIRCIQVDAFSDRPFAGNPAAVCLLEEERDAGWMQSVAAEMNLSETAFVRGLDDGFELRWFTPAIEVDLCGHATLAAAHVLWTEGMVGQEQPIRFHTRSGVLTCNLKNGLIELDFPATPVEEVDPPAGLLEALGVGSSFVGKTKFDCFVVVEDEQVVRTLDPDFARLRRVETRGVVVTSRSDDPRFDFVSRFFAPAAGVDEDPVTGSTHCCLGPYWSEQFGKTEMTAFQASVRGGVLRVRVHGGRVILGGQAVTVMSGELVDTPGTTPTAANVTESVFAAAGTCFTACLETITHCVDQLSEEQVWWRPHPSMNSIGNLLLHLTGNVRQWIVAGIGGAVDVRDRPAEFSQTAPIPKATLRKHLEEAVAEAMAALARSNPVDMSAERRIQGGDVTGWEAIFDSVPHFKGHTQEIVCLTRMQLGTAYEFHWEPQTPEQGAPTP
jgi:PhzF family phenazine biosynthesis protein